jgi:DNA-binding CsgD family transcriptional regulator
MRWFQTTAAASGLTRAEREVAQLAARGVSNSDIASRRRTSERTVANQLASAYAKMGINGRRELRAAIGANVEPEPRRSHRRQVTPPALTSRERQVWGCVAMGQSNKAIAHALGLALSTVATHLERARYKLGGEPVAGEPVDKVRMVSELVRPA